MPTASDGRPVLELVGLRKAYQEGEREHVVLDGVDARVRGGERVAILGPSGSGKSTLLNLVSGIDLPDRGEVRVEGVDLTALSERDRTLFRRHRIGFVFQFFNLLPTLTVLENLLLPVELKGPVGTRARARALDLLREVGLDERADSFPDRLSGGEQQRVAVARALVHEPALVLADEPTGNLDEDTGRRVADLLEGLVRSDGRTLLVVTHARELAGRMDRVLRMSHGKLVEDGR
ncbi:MAG TPA: ABC transporter ATP-binding protein [Longimicrobiales bacterium]|nr:ABC transporter ATP-binding protein [Longimicrobiales bacterium]